MYEGGIENNGMTPPNGLDNNNPMQSPNGLDSNYNEGNLSPVTDFSVQENINQHQSVFNPTMISDDNIEPSITEVNVDSKLIQTINTEGLTEQQIFDLEMQLFLNSDTPSRNIHQESINNSPIQEFENQQIVLDTSSQKYENQQTISDSSVQDAGYLESTPNPFVQEFNNVTDNNQFTIDESVTPSYTAVPSIFDQGNNSANITLDTNISTPDSVINNTSEVASEAGITNTIIQENNGGINSAQPMENSVDFFAYDFANETKPQSEPLEVQAPLSDDLLTFDFDSVIREQHVQEVIPVDNRIEITKVLAPRENTIRKASEAAPEENNVIHINEDNGKSHRRKKAFMKASLYAFYIFLVFFISVFAYNIYQQKTNFTLSRTEISLAISSTYQAEVIMNTNIQDSSNYEWMSADPTIATVSEDGTITALNSGKTTITVKSKKTRKTKEIVINSISIIVDSMRFYKNSITINEGETAIIAPIINDDNSIIIDLTWESSNPNIISVDSNGHITAISPGTATVIAVEEVSGLAAEIEITVKAKKSNNNSNSNSNSNSNNNNKKVDVSGISLNKSRADLKVGETLAVTATVRPANASNKSIVWSSNNTNVATVDSKGKIVAKTAGTATITAKTKDGNKTATIKITVTEATPSTIPVTGISLNKTTLSLEVGESEIIIATVSPNNATNKSLNWSSSNAAVAEISDNGKIIAKTAGTATITVSTVDGNHTATVKVTVSAAPNPTIHVTEVTLNKTSASMNVGETLSLSATVSPNNATNKSVTWSTNDSSVATVNSNGKVEAKGVGTVIITVKTNDGNHTATCTITVADQIENEG